MGIIDSSVMLINSRSTADIQGSREVRDTAQRQGSPKGPGSAQIRTQQKMLE